MDKNFDPKSTEEMIYKMWESGGYFAPNDNPKAKPFTIIMPPPNANDPLHIGHATFVTIEDIMIRYHRMKGDAALWLPGTDHAGIETQFVFEKKLKKDGKSRFDFDRETLYQMVWKYVKENSDIAVSQLKRIGASADWSRFKFTLDPDIVNIVFSTFKKLHEDQLLYRDVRLVNYCTRCGTGYSELEAKHEVRKDPFIHIKYGDFVIGTVRPETKFRDTALAVNPKDKRYKKLIGNSYEIMGLLGPITMKVIGDPEVDPDFGTGMMKVTPAHDFHDFELGKKYDLPVTPIIDLKGKMDFSWFIDDDKFASLPAKYQERARLYHGLHVSKARPLMVDHLKEDGLLVSEDANYEHTVAVCYRCGSLLEPLPLPQFYIKVKPLTDPVLKALKEKKVKILGPGYDKILKHWLKNLKDWNISRQIIWGIRLPVWYSLKENPAVQLRYLKASGEQVNRSAEGVLTANELEEARRGLQQLQAPLGAQYVISQTSPGDDYFQETDTFDTWFSSGQWPFVTLQTTKPGDFARFYPTQVMETAYDILIFWVMRMLMLGIYATGKAPFSTVYLHGLVRDEKGQKMSKSKGNVINPIEVIERHGADALRMALVLSTTAGKDSSTSEDKIRGMRNFTNKIWNAARYVLQDTHESAPHKPLAHDAAFQTHLKATITKITKLLEVQKIGLASEVVYQEFWHWYCDEAIEQNKQLTLSHTLLYEGLVTFLKLLHPFVPFVTEEIWSKLPGKASAPLIITSWPG